METNMVLLLLAVLWVYLTYRSTRLDTFIYSSFVINMALDMAQSPELAGPVSFMRAGFFYPLIGFHFLRRGVFTMNLFLFALLIYTLIGILMSSDVAHSFRFALRVFIPLLMVSLAYGADRPDVLLERLRKLFPKLLLFFCLYVLASNVMGFGVETYGSDKFLSGFLFGSDLHFISLMIIVVLTTAYRGRAWSSLWRTTGLIMSSVATVMLVFTLRRLSVLIIIAGLGFMNLTSARLTITRFIPAILLLGIAGYFTINSGLFKERLEAREGKMAIESLESEMRYVEIGIMYKEVLQFTDPMRSLFGKELFNSMGNYGDGAFKDRMIHVDYFTWLHGGGIVGLILYLGFLISIPLTFRMPLSMRAMADERVRLFWFLYFAQYALSVSGQMYIISFRTFIFVYLGLLAASFRISEKQIHENTVRKPVQ